MTAKLKRITPRQFGDAMHTLGCCLEQADYEVLIGLAWCLIPLDKRRAGVLAAVRRHRPLDLQMPTAKQCRVSPPRRKGEGKRRV